MVLLEKAVKDKDLKQCAAIQRGFKWIWKEISLKDVGQIFEYFLPHLASRMNLPTYDWELVPTDLKTKFHTTAEKAQQLASSTEAKNYFYVLLIMKLIDEKWLNLAKEFVDFASMQLINETSWTMDNLIAKIFYYKGLIYEKSGKLHEVVGEFYN